MLFVDYKNCITPTGNCTAEMGAARYYGFQWGHWEPYASGRWGCSSDPIWGRIHTTEVVAEDSNTEVLEAGMEKVFEKYVSRQTSLLVELHTQFNFGDNFFHVRAVFSCVNFHILTTKPKEQPQSSQPGHPSPYTNFSRAPYSILHFPVLPFHQPVLLGPHTSYQPRLLASVKRMHLIMIY
jgi:hypothetical protein